MKSIELNAPVTKAIVADIAQRPPLSQRLTDVREGASALVIAFQGASPKRAQRLAALGILPGVELTVLQKSPALIVQIEETILAIDREIAHEVLIEQDQHV